MPSTKDPAVKVTFRKLLLNRCQEEFEKDQQNERDIVRRQKEIEETTTVCYSIWSFAGHLFLISVINRSLLGKIMCV